MRVRDINDAFKELSALINAHQALLGCSMRTPLMAPGSASSLLAAAGGPGSGGASSPTGRPSSCMGSGLGSGLSLAGDAGALGGAAGEQLTKLMVLQRAADLILILENKVRGTRAARRVRPLSAPTSSLPLLSSAYRVAFFAFSLRSLSVVHQFPLACIRIVLTVDVLIFSYSYHIPEADPLFKYIMYLFSLFCCLCLVLVP